MVERHALDDHPAHGDAGDVGRLHARGVQHGDAVVGHVGERVGLRRPGGEAGVAVVEADGAVALGDQLLAERLRPAGHLRAQAVDQQDGLRPAVAEACVLDLDVAVLGAGHGGLLRSGQRMRMLMARPAPITRQSGE